MPELRPCLAAARGLLDHLLVHLRPRCVAPHLSRYFLSAYGHQERCHCEPEMCHHPNVMLTEASALTPCSPCHPRAPLTPPPIPSLSTSLPRPYHHRGGSAEPLSHRCPNPPEFPTSPPAKEDSRVAVLATGVTSVFRRIQSPPPLRWRVAGEAPLPMPEPPSSSAHGEHASTEFLSSANHTMTLDCPECEY